ncbi:hypothetical protein CRM22_000985 [Opisthorchis felineus]|uniref:Uncharacterized protein n=2 Tax=Opisthorchis felineus TaxID=147828 RepID=A0A4V3SH02_OPIFE|nr:hypothetical protein CRM22_000985 [Opisthorchis felineus]
MTLARLSTGNLQMWQLFYLSVLLTSACSEMILEVQTTDDLSYEECILGCSHTGLPEDVICWVQCVLSAKNRCSGRCEDLTDRECEKQCIAKYGITCYPRVT